VQNPPPPPQVYHISRALSTPKSRLLKAGMRRFSLRVCAIAHLVQKVKNKIARLSEKELRKILGPFLDNLPKYGKILAVERKSRTTTTTTNKEKNDGPERKQW
jgi:hypothetical protein